MNRRERIREQLQSALSPTHLEVMDESRMHNVPAGAESHFKVVVVSESFAEHSLVACLRPDPYRRLNATDTQVNPRAGGPRRPRVNRRLG